MQLNDHFAKKAINTAIFSLRSLLSQNLDVKQFSVNNGVPLFLNPRNSDMTKDAWLLALFSLISGGQSLL